MRPLVMAAALLSACAVPAAGQDRLLGLLSVPQLFGDEPCQAFSPTDVALYAQPDSSSVVGSIRVETPWTLHEYGGCDGLEVRVHLTGEASTAELPILESSYETPAAIVVERRGAWYRIRVAGGSAWLRATERNRFHPLESLLPDNLSYIAHPDGAGLAATPGAARSAARELIEAERHVRVLEARRVGDELWLRVAVLSDSVCESLDEPVAVAEGWLPAHAASGEPIVWFYARGC